jgi:hypothetical protein
MIDIKQAVVNAKKYAHDVLGASDLLLEEVDSRDNDFEITLSFPTRGMPKRNPLTRRSLLESPAREYKTFAVNKKTGEVLRMSIRQLT